MIGKLKLVLYGTVGRRVDIHVCKTLLSGLQTASIWHIRTNLMASKFPRGWGAQPSLPVVLLTHLLVSNLTTSNLMATDLMYMVIVWTCK